MDGWSDRIPTMDRFPCAHISRPYVSIGSDRSDVEHDFDKLLESAVIKGKAMDMQNASKRSRCSIPMGPLEAWILDITRPAGVNRVLGPVPVHVYGLRFSPSCIAVDETTSIARVEFVLHRYGDAHGIHYQCMISTTLPFRLFAYKHLGTVPAGTLWSVDREFS